MTFSINKRATPPVYVGPFGRVEALRRGIYDTHIMAGVGHWKRMIVALLYQ
jgi:hypothetical protein